MKMLMKLLVLPVWLVLAIVSKAMDIAMKVYCYGLSAVGILLVLSLVVALVGGRWNNVGIVALITVGVILITVAVGLVGAMIEIGRDRVKCLLVR